jgi:tetratricopeptide (TPR) repeat protein
MAVLVSAMFIASFVYRMRHPAMTVTLREAPAADKEAENQEMMHIQELMGQLQASPGDAGAMIELAEAFMTMKALDRAALFLDKAAKIVPGNTRLLRDQGMVAFEHEDYPKARDAFQGILERDARNATAHFNLGVLKRYYLNQTEPAMAHFRAVVEADPSGRVGEMARKELDKP